MSFLYNEKVGVNPNGSKNASIHRVARPPGGQSSNIFGPPIEQEPQKSRVSKTTQSSVFGPPDATDSPSRSRRPQEDTQNKLFGEADPLPPPKPSGNGEAEINNGDKNGGVENGNGEVKNGEMNGNGVTNGKSNENGSPAVKSSTRVRQPPGGASSKLW